ncbi:MAG: protein kinase [Myxococcales bacterium]|nr:protein kinase [Myxococcales bacterium]MCB9520418.1 protein kinase [Myxococcales bacterium]MCB9530316.1 protein kinase [Myxococcales bacterium]MCB9534154.1 protein kinase [Myxococcales bacterium]
MTDARSPNAVDPEHEAGAPVDAAAFAARPITAAQAAAPSAERDPRVGLILSGWRLDALVGEGRTAAVYAASSQDGGRAAVKVMNASLKGDERIRRRLFREANLARRVAHPAVTEILINDITHSGEPFVVMERLYGRDLGRLLVLTGRPLATDDILFLAVEVLDLVDHCHRLGLSHRNLAPFNIYLTTEGHAKVFDFGSSWVKDDTHPQTLEALGTDLHGYIAPELIGVRPQLGDPRSDLFSLGCVLLTLATGRLIGDSAPFAAWPATSVSAADPASAIPYDQLEAELPALLGDLDPRLQSVIGSSARAPVEQRFASARDMREAVLQQLGEARLDALDANKRRARLAKLIGALYDSRDELEREETGAWRSAELLRDVFRLVENTLYSARRHGWDHGETEVRLEFLVQRVLATVADDAEGIFWVVRPYSLEYRGEAFWKPDAPFDKITYNLFDAGFRKMHLLPGLDAQECRDFLRWLVLDPEHDLALEDDLATIFWQREFQHIRCQLVSAVVLQDVEDYEQLDNELKGMRADAIDHLRATIASRLSGSHDAVGAAPDEERVVEYVVSRGSLLDIDPGVMRDVGTSMSRMMPLWRGRLAEICVQAIRDASFRGDLDLVVEPYDTFVAAALNDGRLADALELFAGIGERLREPRQVRRLARPFTSEGALPRLLRLVIPLNERVVYGDELPFLRSRLPLLLAQVPPEQTPALIEAAARCHERTLLALLLRAIERHANEHIDPLGDLLRSAHPLLGSNIISILAQHMNAQTAAALEAGYANPHPKVRVEVAEVLARYSPQRALRELRSLLRHEEAPIRQRAVEAIGRNKLRDAALDLFQRLDERGFHQLPIAERRAIMSTACAIAEEEGEAALVRLVESHGVVANEELDASRALAVELLRDAAMTDRALEATRDAARKRWWNSAELQAAATAAVPVIEARLASLDSELAKRGRTRED